MIDRPQAASTSPDPESPEADLEGVAKTLTGPQLDLLGEVCRRGSQGVCEKYRPAQKLVALGLVGLHDQRFGGKVARPTDLGSRVYAFRQAADRKEHA